MAYNSMKILYNRAKLAKVGEIIGCPSCGKKHKKTTYNKVFCSNARTRSRRNCKDMFWNKIDPEKRCRNTPYFHDVICNKNDDDGYDKNGIHKFEDDHPFSMEATNWGGCKD